MNGTRTRRTGSARPDQASFPAPGMAGVRHFLDAETSTMTRSQRALLTGGAGALGLLAIPALAVAEETAAAAPPAINGADTAFVLICAALVMLMTPGLGL